MSNDKTPARAADANEITDDQLEEAAGGIIDGGCIGPFPGDPFPQPYPQPYPYPGTEPWTLGQ